MWRALKRTLNHNRLEIQPLEMFYPFATTALKPEPMEINVKVILIGDRQPLRDAVRIRRRLPQDF